MADSSIAKTSLQMSADAQPMLEGMRAAGSAITSWASTIGGTIKSSGIGTAITTILSPLTMVKNMALNAVMGQVGTLKDKYKELSGEIVESSRWAHRLGTSTEDMMALEAGFGGAVGGVESLHTVLSKFRQNIAGGDLIGELAKFADTIKGIESPTDRARLAVEMLGKKGVIALNVLEQGGDKILAKMQLMKDIGFTVSDKDAQKIEAANGGLSRMGQAVQGIYNQMMVGMAPAITYVSDLFLRMAPYINYVGKALGAITDVYFRVAVEMITELGSQVGSFGREILKGMGYSEQWFSAFPGWGDTAKMSMYVLATAIANVWDVMKVAIGKMMEYSFGMLRAIGRAAQVMGLGWGERMEEIGVRWSVMGMKMQDNFGKTKIAVDKIFLGMAKASGDTANKMKDDMSSVFTYAASAAMLQGSKEAISIEARWKTAQLAGKDPITGLANKQLVELEEIKKAVVKMANEPRNGMEVAVI